MIPDPPSDAAPLSEWKRYLDALKRLAHEHPESLDVREHIQLAQQRLAEG